MTDSSDILIIGGGIAGLSLAAALGDRASVRLLEQEQGLAHHTSSRSARQMQPSYGPEPVRVLTEVSIGLVREIEARLGAPLLRPRPLYWLALDDAVDLEPLRAAIPGLRRVAAAEPGSRLPILRAERVRDALLDPLAQEVDVPRLLDWYAGEARRAGTEIVTDARVSALTRHGELWTATVGDGPDARTFSAPIVVNAAGAWADQVAALAGVGPAGLVPLRRTVALARLDAAIDPDWPMVNDAGGSLYFRPDGDRLLSSALEDTPAEPHDAQPLPEVVARVTERLAAVVTPRVEFERAWTGLRTGAPDGVPVVGFDSEVPGFYWLAGQSGYGIQTSAAFGALAAADLLDLPLDAAVAAGGAAVAPSAAAAAFGALAPGRFGDAALRGSAA
ncbi:FAD-dependent oxidoreductase [Gryllotalpicola daejeonensis]